MDLNKLVDAKFLDDSKEESICNALPPSKCDAGPLPPGCDCICHTPCDFGIEGNSDKREGLKYSSNLAKNEVYEMN